MAILADKFFESYDLLPSGFKDLIYSSATCPTMEDLQEVWALVQTEGSFDQLFREHARRYDPDEWKKIREREREKYERQKAQKPSKWDLRWQRQREGRYVTTTYRVLDDKQTRLVERVKAEIALDMVTKKQAKVVNKPGTLVTRTDWVPYKSKAERDAEQRALEMQKHGFDLYAAPDKNAPKAGTNKRLGNSY